jgi:uncharacterized damage-inducible protein DinB
MIKETILEMFERDARKVIDEVMLYKNEEDLWKVVPGINNSAGNLCLHLTGNLNHFIGAVLGKTGYIRNRDSEFTLKGVSRTEMIAGMESVIKVIHDTFQNMSDDDLSKDFPVDKHGQQVTTAYMLLHLMTHLNYHIGQMNYHRRMIEHTNT